jgi:carboxypeptidase family protein
MTSRLLTPVVVLLLSLGCSPGGPVIDTGPRPDVGGSISGIVTANDGATALGARKVTAVNVETGARIDTSTTSTGGYTMRVPRGTYRLEVELRPGETLRTQPDSTEVNAGDLDAGRNFVVAVATQR